MTRRMLTLFALILALSVNVPAAVRPTLEVQATAAQTPSQRTRTFKPELRAKGEELLAETDEIKRSRLAGELIRADAAGTLDFMIELLETDPSPRVRTTIVDGIGRMFNPKVREALERRASMDPDVGVARLALERLRFQVNAQMRSLLTKRIQLAREKGDEAGLRQLADEQERWISLVRGTMLPSFMRVAPPLFSLKEQDKPVRVLSFGDFGTGTPNQQKTAAAMVAYHKKSPFDFGITMGDNFYPVGMNSPGDPRWKAQWEDLYGPLGIKFWITMGNHDWGSADSPAAELLYARESSSWKMPAPYYTYTAGPVQFFAIDSNEISEAQLIWLREQLDKSRSRWKIVYGHHPIYSAGQHGDGRGLILQLLPVLKGRADVYLAGHDHDLQHLKPEGALHFFVSGGGGAGIRPITPGPRSLFAKSSYGFSVLEANANDLKVTFISSDGEKLYEYTLRKE